MSNLLKCPFQNNKRKKKGFRILFLDGEKGMSWVGADPLNVGQDNLCLRNPSGSLQYWASDDQYSDYESVVFLISVFFCASAFFFSPWVFFFQFPFFFSFFFPFQAPLEVNGVVGGLQKNMVRLYYMIKLTGWYLNKWGEE